MTPPEARNKSEKAVPEAPKAPLSFAVANTLGVVIEVTNVGVVVEAYVELSKEITEPFAFKKPVPFDVVEVVILSSVILRSGIVIVRTPPVDAPVILNWFVPGVLDVPANQIAPHGFVVEPKSSPPAVPGMSAVLIATDAKLSRALVAKFVTDGMSVV